MRGQEMPKEGVIEAAARYRGRITRAVWSLWVLSPLFAIDRFPHFANLAGAVFYAVAGVVILKTRNMALMIVAGSLLMLGVVIGFLTGVINDIRIGMLPAWILIRLFLEFLAALFLFRAAQAAHRLKRDEALVAAPRAFE